MKVNKLNLKKLLSGTIFAIWKSNWATLSVPFILKIGTFREIDDFLHRFSLVLYLPGDSTVYSSQVIFWNKFFSHICSNTVKWISKLVTVVIWCWKEILQHIIILIFTRFFFQFIIIYQDLNILPWNLDNGSALPEFDLTFYLIFYSGF